ncbi:RRP12-like protein isoform X1 [Leptopilina heterotoma]|uniref:RRP12-like protein isoform X1 n=1 Tax=Leptopilina heterotoma TaxID=63436 RepID=UPI001CA8BE28|nr:RRP12-like protein isoform X1 [Leptopilina heterotoma]
MAKIKPRLGSRKKAKRWAKGQSSSSNPEIKKHRNQARTWFFQQNPDSSGLTTEVLRKHDVLQGTAPTSEKIDIDDESSAAGASTFKTFNTFASDYSKCSNMSFNRFLTQYQPNSVIHKEMLAILAAVTDVIKQNDGIESDTEYYAALMTTLEAAETDESITAILSLLGMILKSVPKNVLKLQFSQASEILLQVLIKYATNENFLVQRHCIGCLQILLRAQEVAVWSDSSTLQVLDALLTFTIHTKPKVRKAAQHGICAILKGSDIMKVENPPPYHPAASQVAKHCISQLESAGKPGHLTNTLHILTMLKEICHQLPKTYVKNICESLLSIMTLNNVLVTSCCFQTFHGLFISKPSESVLPPQLNAQIINALYDYQPASTDTQPTLAWLTVMQEAYANLALHSLDLCAANLPRFIEKAAELWLSDKTDVITGASHAIKHVIQECVSYLCVNEQIASRHKATLKKIIHLIQEGLKYQYSGAWHHVLHLLAILFQVIGLNCKEDLAKILITLADLRDTHKFTYNSEIEYAVGAAVKSMGPEIVLNTIPLQNLNRSWLLPILKDCISNAPLSYFIKSLLPLAVHCQIKAKTLQENKDGIGAHSYELMRSQIWSLLPNFCNNPSDIKISFESDFAKTLGTLIGSDKSLRFSAMASLRRLITASVEKNNQEDIETLAKFAKNYLPILFNLYSTKPHGSDEEGQRIAAFETIKVYLSITNKEYLDIFFDTAMKKIQEEKIEEFEKESVFDLFRLFAQFTDIDRVKIFYEFCIPLLMQTSKQKEQKKAYRFLEEVCSSDNEVCKQFVLDNRRAIQSLMKKSQKFVHKICKGARIRVIICLVKSHPQLEKTKFLQAIVPEAVVCLKEVNEKCRSSSYQLLNTIAEKFLDNEEHFMEYIQLLTSGLGDTPILCSATLLALSSVLYNYTGSLGIETVKKILDHACNLLTGPTREITISCLAFVKVYLTVMPTPIIGPTLSKIVESLSKMTDDCKRHCRLKVRDILIKMARKFGIEPILNMVPETDETMRKRLKNIRKIENRKQKTKDDKKSQNDGEEEFSLKRMPKSMEEILADSDEEFDDVDMKDGGKNSKLSKTKTWIQESEDNIVDFADPTASKNIVATKPGVSLSKPVKGNSKDSGFKTAGDGRLIINDDTDNESDEEETKKKKKTPFLGMKEDDDYEDDEDDVKSAKSVKKRKRDNSSVHSETFSSSSKYKAGGSGIHRPIKVSKSEREPGAEYRASKAKGDVTIKGKQKSYAYLPLTRSSLNKRKKMKNAGKFKGIISGAKKGALAGKKNQKKRKI